MHNQDTTKDDILEALFELSKMAAQYLSDHFKQLKLQAEQKRIQDEALKAMQELNGTNPVDLENDPHRLFKDAMKYIEENTDDIRIKNMAKLFYENPLDGIKMIDEVQNHKRQDQAIQLSESSKEIIENLKRAQEINSQKVEPDLQTEQMLNNLIQQEESKLESAATILKHDIDLENSPLSSIENEDIKEIVQLFKDYVNNVDIENVNSEISKNEIQESITLSEDKELSNQQHNEESWNIKEYRKNNEIFNVNTNQELEKALFSSENSNAIAIERTDMKEEDKQHIIKVITSALELEESGFVNDDRGIMMVSENKFYVNQHHKYDITKQQSHVFEIVPSKWIELTSDSFEEPEKYFQVTYDFNDKKKNELVEPTIFEQNTKDVIRKMEKQQELIADRESREKRRDIDMER